MPMCEKCGQAHSQHCCCTCEQKQQPRPTSYARGRWARQPARDKVTELKEMIDWQRERIGPENADRLKIRIDDLFRSAVRHGKKLAQKR